MDSKMKVAIVVIVVLVLAIPLAGKLMTEEKTADNAKNAAAETGKKGGKAIARGAAKGAEAAPVKLDPPLLNAQNLVNTRWQMNIQGIDVKVSLGPNGVATAESPPQFKAMLGPTIQGQWSVNGATLTVTASAMGQTKTATAQISGDKILVNGTPVTRLQ